MSYIDEEIGCGYTEKVIRKGGPDFRKRSRSMGCISRGQLKRTGL